MEHGPTTTTSRSSRPCSTLEIAARLLATSACALSGVGSHSCSSAGVISGRTAPMRRSSMRVVSWVDSAVAVRTWMFMMLFKGVYGLLRTVELRLQLFI